MRTTVVLGDDLNARVQREARRRGTSVSAVVREALERELGSGHTVPFAGLVHEPSAPWGEDLEDALAEEAWDDAIDGDRR